MTPYEERRAQALAALKKLGPGPIPLSVAVMMLPDKPEWAEYRPKRKKRARPSS